MPEITIPYNFKPYKYQIPLYNAIPDGFKRGFAIMHRRAGKDKIFMNVLAREAVKVVGTYFYILPYYKQARLIIWEGTDNTGFRYVDHIPPPLVKRKENQQNLASPLEETARGVTPNLPPTHLNPPINMEILMQHALDF